MYSSYSPLVQDAKCTSKETIIWNGRAKSATNSDEEGHESLT